MGDPTEYLHQRMNDFDNRQRAIIASQAACEEQNKQIFHEIKDLKTDVKILVSQAERRKGVTNAAYILWASVAGLLGGIAGWLIHHMGILS